MCLLGGLTMVVFSRISTCMPDSYVLFCTTGSQQAATTPTEIGCSYRCAVTQQQCTTALARANCIPHCSVLLCKNRLTAGMGHCNYTCGDLLFIQVYSDPTAMHYSTGQGKLHSPFFSVALQKQAHSGPGSLQLHLWKFAVHIGVQ